jgi:hypothetical protein
LGSRQSQRGRGEEGQPYMHLSRSYLLLLLLLLLRD